MLVRGPHFEEGDGKLLLYFALTGEESVGGCLQPLRWVNSTDVQMASRNLNYSFSKNEVQDRQVPRSSHHPALHDLQIFNENPSLASLYELLTYLEFSSLKLARFPVQCGGGTDLDPWSKPFFALDFFNSLNKF